MAETLHSIQLLQASTDKEDESEVRSLVDGNFVRYVTVAAGLLCS